MTEEKYIRLGQVARMLNVNTATVVEVLLKLGYQTENIPQSKLTLSQAALVEQALSLTNLKFDIFLPKSFKSIATENPNEVLSDFSESAKLKALENNQDAEKLNEETEVTSKIEKKENELEGKISSLNSNFGFITYENSQSIFFHFSKVEPDYKFAINDQVLFEKVESKLKRGKFEAINVRRNEAFYKQFEESQKTRNKILENNTKVNRWLGGEFEDISINELVYYIKNYNFKYVFQRHIPKVIQRYVGLSLGSWRGSIIKDFENPFIKIFHRISNSQFKEEFFVQIINSGKLDNGFNRVQIFWALFKSLEDQGVFKDLILKEVVEVNDPVLILIFWFEYYLSNVSIKIISDGLDKFRDYSYELRVSDIIERLNKVDELCDFLKIVIDKKNDSTDVDKVSSLSLLLNENYTDQTIKSKIIAFFNDYLDDNLKFLLWRKKHKIRVDNYFLGKKVAELDLKYTKGHDLDFIKSFEAYNRLLIENKDEFDQKLIIEGFIDGLKSDQDPDLVSVKVISILNVNLGYPDNRRLINGPNRIFFIERVIAKYDPVVNFNLWLMDLTTPISVELVLDKLFYASKLKEKSYYYASNFNTSIEKVVNFLNHYDSFLNKTIDFILLNVNQFNEDQIVRIFIFLLEKREEAGLDITGVELNKLVPILSPKSQFKLWANNFSKFIIPEQHLMYAIEISLKELKIVIEKDVFLGLKEEDFREFLKFICISKDHDLLDKVKYILNSIKLTSITELKSVIFDSVSHSNRIILWRQGFYNYIQPDLLLNVFINDYSSDVVLKAYKDNLLNKVISILEIRYDALGDKKIHKLFGSFLSEKNVNLDNVLRIFFNKFSFDSKKSFFKNVFKSKGVKFANSLYKSIFSETYFSKEFSFFNESVSFIISEIPVDVSSLNYPNNYSLVNSSELLDQNSNSASSEFYFFYYELIYVFQDNFNNRLLKNVDIFSHYINSLNFEKSKIYYGDLKKFFEILKRGSASKKFNFYLNLDEFFKEFIAKLNSEKLIKFWVYDLIDYFDYYSYANYYFLLTSDERRTFNKKAKALMGNSIKEAMLKKRVPWVRIESSISDHQCYEATWRSVWFHNGSISFCKDSKPSFSPFFKWDFSEEKFNLIFDYLSGRRLNPLKIYLNKNNIVKVEGLEELEEVIFKVLIIHEVEAGKSKSSHLMSSPKIPNNLLLRNKSIQFLNKLQLVGLEPSRILEKTFNIMTGGFSVDVSLLYSIPYENDSVAIIWESLELDKAKATHVFKCSLLEYNDIFSEIELSLNSINKIRSLLNSSNYEDVIKQKSLKYLGKVDHSNYDYFKWESDLLSYFPSLSNHLKII